MKFYDSIGIKSVILEKPNFLRQSISLSYSRYQYLKSMKRAINKNNFKKLFYGEKQFVNQYSITNEELLNLYPYEILKIIKIKQNQYKCIEDAYLVLKDFPINSLKLQKEEVSNVY